jgi:hypothetical protein
VGGVDNDIITDPGDNSDRVMYTTSNLWGPFHNCDGDKIPAAYSVTGNDCYVNVINGNYSTDALHLFEVNTTPDPDQLSCPALPGRPAAERERSILTDLTTQLGLTSPLSCVMADYSVFRAQATLYILANGGGDTYHLIALTPGPDGVFGEYPTAGTCDDVAVGYTFGEPGAGNSYQVERQHITWESAPGDTTLLNIHGSYNTGYTASAYDPNTRYIYLHGSGDYANGIIIKDISSRTTPPPAGSVVTVH